MAIEYVSIIWGDGKVFHFARPEGEESFLEVNRRPGPEDEQRIRDIMHGIDPDTGKQRRTFPITVARRYFACSDDRWTTGDFEVIGEAVTS